MPVISCCAIAAAEVKPSLNPAPDVPERIAIGAEKLNTLTELPVALQDCGCRRSDNSCFSDLTCSASIKSMFSCTLWRAL